MLRRDDYHDHRIKAYLAKAESKILKDVDDRIVKVKNLVENLQEPLKAKFLDISRETEGLARQNVRFLALYRECLTELSKEIREKKAVLDTSQLAFLTADPGLV